jgi:hypothetical protein
MGDGPTDPPLRQLTRLRTEASIATAKMAAGLFGENSIPGGEFAAVARICLRDWAQGSALARPAVAKRKLSVRKLSNSLGAPRETTRRQCTELIDRGIFAAAPQGVFLALTEANEALVLRYYDAVHDWLVRLIEDAHSTCDIAWPVAERASFGVADVIERSLDMLLQPVDTFRLPGMSRLAHLLWGALAAVAVRGVTFDPVLSRRYANAIPPDALRAGISLRRLSAAMRIPYATAWRQMQMLEEKGFATRLANDRWAVLESNLSRQPVRDIATTPSTLLLPRLRELAALGLNPARAADHYRVGRPALIDFGDVASRSKTREGESPKMSRTETL